MPKNNIEMPEPVELLSPEEVEELIVRVVAANGPLTREELEAKSSRVIKWAEDVRFDSALLRLIFDGRMEVIVPDDTKSELMFRPSTPK